MFNSPLHYCTLCKQYVALDQSVEECAREHGCKIESCSYPDLFSPPASTQDAKPAEQLDRPVNRNSAATGTVAAPAKRLALATGFVPSLCGGD